jgi:hypothetical protein
MGGGAGASTTVIGKGDTEGVGGGRRYRHHCNRQHCYLWGHKVEGHVPLSLGVIRKEGDWVLLLYLARHV